jgi:uncharacterized protein (DUF2384 family)
MGKTTGAKARGPIARRHGKSRSTAKRAATGGNGERPATSFSERKSFEELAAEQGVRPTKLEDILGKGADLWRSDQEFEQFVEDIYARRRDDRELAKQ